jgi:hypothetical protein
VAEAAAEVEVLRERKPCEQAEKERQVGLPVMGCQIEPRALKMICPESWNLPLPAEAPAVVRTLQPVEPATDR